MVQTQQVRQAPFLRVVEGERRRVQTFSRVIFGSPLWHNAELQHSFTYLIPVTESMALVDGDFVQLVSRKGWDKTKLYDLGYYTVRRCEVVAKRDFWPTGKRDADFELAFGELPGAKAQEVALIRHFANWDSPTWLLVQFTRVKGIEFARTAEKEVVL